MRPYKVQGSVDPFICPSVPVVFIRFTREDLSSLLLPGTFPPTLNLAVTMSLALTRAMCHFKEEG